MKHYARFGAVLAALLSAAALSQAAPDSIPAAAAPAVAPAAASVGPLAPVAPLAPDGMPAPAGYRVHVDDVLQLTVWGEPSIQGVYISVTATGTIDAPVVGSVQASGRTVEEIKDEIARRFVEMDYLRDPTVQLTLYQVHKMKVRVLGQVQRPGLQMMREGDTVDHAVAEAGGFITDSAGLRKATITRVGAAEPIPINLEAFYREGDLTANIPVRDGDTIYIPEDTENKIYVMGYVQQPRQYPYKSTTTATEAVSQAGGVVPRGSLKNTVVVRKPKDGQPGERIKVDVAKILRTGDRSGDIRLEPGDVVFVPETRALDLSKIGQALGALANASYLSRIGFF